MDFLLNKLRKVRVLDDQGASCSISLGISPGRGNSKYNENNRGTSPNKQSPNKPGAKHNDSYSNNGQVMTQISAIYSKRSRSILNQIG